MTVRPAPKDCPLTRTGAAGAIVAVNEPVTTKPDLINAEPYGAGWIARIKPVNWEADRAALVTGAEGVEAYRAFLDTEGIKCE